MTAPASDSIGQLAIELAKLLEPLATELAPGHEQAFLAEIGIPVTAAQAATLAGPLHATVTATEQLVAVVPQVIAALIAEDWGTAIEKGLLATVRVGQVISGLDGVASAASGLHPDAGQVAERTFDFLLARYLDAAHGLNDALEFLGLLTRQDFNIDVHDASHPPYTLYSYDFGAITDWLSDPAAKAAALYGWGPGFDGAALFPRLRALLANSGLPVLYDSAAVPPVLDVVFLELAPTTSGPAGLVIRLKDTVTLGPQTLPLGQDLSLEVEAEFSPPGDTRLTILTDGTIVVTPPTPAPLSGRLGARFIVARDGSHEPFVLFGVAGGSRLEFGEFVLAVAAGLQWSGGAASGDLDLSGMVNGGKVVIDATSGDGFLTKILPGTRVEADFSLVLGVSTERGFYFSGSSALEIRLPTHIELGPVSIEGLTLAAGLAGGQIPLSIGADIRATLGPLVAVVQNMGVTATVSFPPGNHGNLGPAQLDLGFKPPTGVGLRVDAGPIAGGGFLGFNASRGEYFGALELSFEGVISLKAVGIINTKLPDGTPGFALLILVTAEFTPIQLGFGITLNGVGGLLGLNRSLDTEALRQGVRTGSVTSILFPPDVVGNITRIISDLQSFFPVTQGHFVMAPMGKFGWGTPTLISLEVGVILDIPSPQLTIIGVLRCILPEEDAPVLRLQVNFAGGIDFDRGLIWFDASLFDSSLLIFTLTGDMALRIGWGDQSILVISVGGFHPKFHEIPPDLTRLRRLSIALLSGDNPRLMASAYFAITSNTVQSGARVELYAAACGFNIYGFLGYDLLVQFNPFHFIADIYAGLALRQDEDVLFGINVHCELSGPQPWNANGEASIGFLFFSITIGFDVTWGEEAPALGQDTVDVLALVVAAVGDARNWRALMPANSTQTITLRSPDVAPATVLLHPFGVLAVSQKVAPLDYPIDRFGNQKPVGNTTFSMTWAGGAAAEVREEFAVANFTTLTDDQKLARKSFEQLKAGLQLSAGQAGVTGVSVGKEVSYERSYVHRKRGLLLRAGTVSLVKLLFDTLVGGGAATSSPLSAARRRGGANGPAPVSVEAGAYHVVGIADLAAPASVAPGGSVAATEAEAYALHDAIVRDHPALAGTLQVLAAHELAPVGA
jgi:hypothetical protein